MSIFGTPGNLENKVSRQLFYEPALTPTFGMPLFNKMETPKKNKSQSSIILNTNATSSKKTFTCKQLSFDNPEQVVPAQGTFFSRGLSSPEKVDTKPVPMFRPENASFNEEPLKQSLKRGSSTQSSNEKKGLKIQRTDHFETTSSLIESPSYKVLCENAKKKCFEINNKKISVEHFADGTFQNVYKINADHQIICDTPNENVLLKVFNEPLSKLPEDNIKKYTQNSIDNYRIALKLGLPCAEIFNVDTALNDRYYLVKMIPGTIDLKNENHLQQICRFFKVTFENKYTCDLTYDNLRVQNDGTVTLIDYAEKKLNYEKIDSIRMYSITFLMGWGRKVRDTYNLYEEEGRSFTKKLLDRFTENLGYEDDWIETALDEHFSNFRVDV